MSPLDIEEHLDIQRLKFVNDDIIPIEDGHYSQLSRDEESPFMSSFRNIEIEFLEPNSDVPKQTWSSRNPASELDIAATQLLVELLRVLMTILFMEANF